MSNVINHNNNKDSFLSAFTNKVLLKKKIKAFSTHLFLSALLITSFFLFAVSYWFPNNSLQLTGIVSILLMIFFIDLILGPALTFLVFNPSKKSLKFDLSAIVFLQLVMFIYGAYTVYQAHPVYITFTVDRFVLVSARDANPSEAKHDEYKTSSLSKPIYAYAESPTESEARNKLLFESVVGGLDLDAHAEYYLPYKVNIDKIIKRGLPVENIFTTKKQKALLTEFLQKNKFDINNLFFLPVEGKAKFMTYVLDKTNAKPVGIIDIDPWLNEEAATQAKKNEK